MVFAECIQKNRGSDNTVSSYVLQSLKGQTMTITGQQLKQAILNKQIDLDNLRVSKDGKIVDREKGYYRLVGWRCDEQGNRVYKVLRMRMNKTAYQSKEGAVEKLELDEQTFIEAVRVKYISIDKIDVGKLKAFMRLYPITHSEWQSASITEDRYWSIIENVIAYGEPVQKTKTKEYINTLINDIDYNDIFSIRGSILEQELLFRLPKNEAIGFCKMSLDLHNKYYAGKEKKELPVWWAAIRSCIGGCSDDTYNDYVYGMIGLGREAFYDFYNNPTKECFNKYAKTLYHSTCEISGYALTCIHEDLINI